MPCLLLSQKGDGSIFCVLSCANEPYGYWVVGWDNRSSSFWPRSSDHFDHFGKHQSGIYMPQGPEFIRCDYPNPLPDIAPRYQLTT